MWQSFRPKPNGWSAWWSDSNNHMAEARSALKRHNISKCPLSGGHFFFCEYCITFTIVIFILFLMKRRKALLYISLTGVGAAAVLSGYEWHAAKKKPDIDWLGRNRELVAALAECIIPATDSPGAREAGVHDFILKMVRDCAEVREQNIFIDGLKELQGRCKSKYGHGFELCQSGEQGEILKSFEEQGKPVKGLVGKIRNRYLGKSFFVLLKQYTVEGYCTSEPGATRGLVYIYIPGHYEGCTALQPGQKAWATN
jgi:hypothetical protein